MPRSHIAVVYNQFLQGISDCHMHIIYMHTNVLKFIFNVDETVQKYNMWNVWQCADTQYLQQTFLLFSSSKGKRCRMRFNVQFRNNYFKNIHTSDTSKSKSQWAPPTFQFVFPEEFVQQLLPRILTVQPIVFNGAIPAADKCLELNVWNAFFWLSPNLCNATST